MRKISEKSAFKISLYFAVIFALYICIGFFGQVQAAQTETTNIETVKGEVVFQMPQTNWRMDEDPSFSLSYNKKSASGIFHWVISPLGTDAINPKVELIPARGETIELEKDKNYILNNTGIAGINLKKTEEINPGRYTLKTSFNLRSQEYVFEQDFSWGVLAVNTNKSIYLSGEEAKLAIAVLDENGDMVCNANVSLNIKDPSENIQNLSTDNGKIRINPECHSKEVTLVPDYEASYQTGKAGSYQISLTAQTASGVFHIQDNFIVEKNVPFEVERLATTRIYPVNIYPVTFNIIANQDFKGVIQETVPESFVISKSEQSEIISYDQEETKENQKILTWNLTLKKGDKISIGYEYDSPDKSPEFYLLGPLQFKEKTFGLTILERTVFEEARKWQIAVDVDPNMLLFWAGSGGSCSGAGAPPTGWTLVSGGSFTGVFPRGNGTYGANAAGDSIHYHSATISISGNTPATRGSGSGSTVASIYHSHSGSYSSVSSISSLPAYKNLCVISYSGIPTTIPNGAIAIFATGTVPTNWQDYASTFGTNYIRGNTTPGGTGGSNTHAGTGHTVSGITMGGSSGGTTQTSTSGTTEVSADGHTHDMGDLTSDTPDTQPPYITVELYQATADTTLVRDMVAMFDGSGYSASLWTTVSGVGGDFYQRFPKVTGTYGTTGGAAQHTHAQMSGQSGYVSGWSNPTSDNNYGESISVFHQHSFYGDLSVDYNTNLPPYSNVVFGKYTPTITVSGTADGSVGATVRVAVDGTLQSQTATIAAGSPNTWSISLVPMPTAGQTITVWINSAADSAESTAVTNYSSGTTVSGMMLDANVLTIGSNQNSSVSLTNLGQYDNSNNSDIMHESASSTLTVDPGGSKYATEKISILASNTLAVGTSETVSTYSLDNAGTITSTGNAAYSIYGNWVNSGTFTASTSTVTLSGSAAQALSGTLTGSSAFYNLTVTNASGASASDNERTGFTAGVDFNAAATVSNNYTITTANVRVEYESAATYILNNINWNGQATGTKIYFRNSIGGGTWLLKVTGTQTAVSYVNVSRSDASVACGNAVDASIGTNADAQNNVNWLFTSGKPIYRSVGPGISAVLANGASNHLNISCSTATFDSALADNIGVGDVLEYDDDNNGTIDSSDSLAFISGRTSSTVFTIKNSIGETPTAPSGSDEVHWNINRAYTSLANAEGGTENTQIDSDLRNFDTGDRDLVTNKEQWNIACYANGTTADTAAVNISDWTTSANDYIKIYTPTTLSEVGTSQRHAGKWDDTKYRMTAGILISNGNVKIDGLQIFYAGAAYIISIANSDNNAEVSVSNNIIKNDNTAGTMGIRFYPSGSGVTGKAWNNIIYGLETTNSSTRGIYSSGGGNFYVYNNTVIGSYIGYYSPNYIFAKNNIAQSTIVGFMGTFPSSSNNLSDHADAPGLNPQNSKTVAFVDATNKDFHLATTDTAARNAGTDLSADTYLPFNTDIDGQNRPVGGIWDIGADEAGTSTRIQGGVKVNGGVKIQRN